MTRHDVVIIGAGTCHATINGQLSSNEFCADADPPIGVFGIAAARTYLEVHPESDVIILESDDVLGGVWSRSR